MEKSASRQRPANGRYSAEYPRIVFFVPDGSLFIGIATHPDAVGYDDIEMLERTPSAEWRMLALDLSQRDSVIRHTAGGMRGPTCTGCHGRNQRPIWGAYPEWPGAFGNGAGHELTAVQAEALTKVLMTEDHPNTRLKSLAFKKLEWRVNDAFVLPGRFRGLSNEAFNDAIGIGHSQVLWARAKAQPRFDLLMQAHLLDGMTFFETDVDGKRIKLQVVERIDRMIQDRHLTLPSGSTLSDKALHLLGLSPYNNLTLRKSVPVLEQEKPEADVIYLYQQWNYVATWIGDLLTVRYLLHVQEQYPQYLIASKMATIPHEYNPTAYSSVFAYLNDSTNYMFRASLSERLQLHTVRAPPTVDLRSPQIFTAKVQEAIGPELIKLITATLAR